MANKCEGCGLESGTAEYVGINLLNGHLLLCRPCLAELNGKNPELKELQNAVARALNRDWEDEVERLAAWYTLSQALARPPAARG